MEKIIVDSGFEEFEVTDKRGRIYGTVQFNPSDMNLINRYEDVAEKMAALSDDVPDDADVVEAKKMCEKKVYDLIDYLFDAPVANVFFAVTSPFSPLASGDLYVESVLNALSDKIEQYTGKRVDKVQAKVNKYAAKYQQNGKFNRQAMIDDIKRRNGYA